MRLLIDASSLADDSAYRGIGTYVRHLLAGLAAERDLSVTALVRPGTQLPQGIRPLRMRRVAPGRFRRQEHDLLLPFDLRRHRAEVFHSPALDPPRRYGGRWVQTLHGLMPLVFGDPELAAERLRLRRQLTRYRAADTVVAISRYLADEAVSRIGLDSRRIEIIPHGVGPEFKLATAQAAGAADEPYLLMVAEYSPRKGYAEAFAAIGALAELGYPHRLRVAARLAPWVRPVVERLVAAAPRPDRIELLGYRSSKGAGAEDDPAHPHAVADLVTQYQNASLLLVASRYESFCLPILEAMACGTPAVAFANSAIPEVVGDAGMLVADGDVSGLVSAIRRFLDEPGWRGELSERAAQRARGFSWEQSVNAHVEVYRRLAA